MAHIVPVEVAEALGRYVYLLRDPRDGQVFYVGKGVGSRVFAHVAEAAGADPATERAKLHRIRQIESAGLEVEHLIVRSGLATDAEAFVVEQSVIDAFRAQGVPLTNIMGGHESAAHGLATVGAAIARWAAPDAPPRTEPTVMSITNRAWRPDMSDAQIYESTRGHWRVGLRVRTEVRLAMGVAFGVVRGAYVIDDWYKSEQPGEEQRFGFHGHTDPELTARFVGTSVRRLVPEKGAQNPVRLYWP